MILNHSDVIAVSFALLSFIISLPSKLKLEAFYFEEKLKLKNPHKIARKSFYLTTILSTSIVSLYFFVNIIGEETEKSIIITLIILTILSLYSIISYRINRNKKVNYEESFFEKKINKKLLFFTKVSIHTAALAFILLHISKLAENRFG